MSSVQHLREFIRERLTAAAEEIFTEFERTIVQYEEELDRQSRLLALCWKPQRHLNTPELPQHHVYKEEERLCNQERNCGRNQQEPEPAQIKNKHIEFWTRREDEHLLLKKDTDSFLWKSRVSVNSTVQLEEEMDGQHRPSQINFHSAEPPQQQVNEEEDILNDQQLSDQDKNSSLERHIQTRVSPQITVNQEEPEPPQIKMDQEKPEPPQIKVDLEEPEPSHIKESQKEPEPPQVLEDQEELFSSQDEEQLVLKEEPDIFMVTVNYEESEQSEAEPGSTQLLSHSSHSSPLKGESCLDAGEIKPYSCSTCGKRFSDLSSLNFHQQTHQDEKPFSCETCLKRFRRRDSMLRHMITHTGERPYSCQVCGDRFGLNSHLLRHMRTHTGEKPFSCKFCHKSFSQSNSLICHMRRHTGEKPYSCEECGKCFVNSGALIVHTRTHTGEKPFFCKICEKRFSQRSRVKDHERTHTGERPYSCNFCGKCFIQSCHLRTHIKNVHV